MSTKIVNCDVQFIEEVDGLVRETSIHHCGYIVEVNNKLDLDKHVCLYTLPCCFYPVLSATDFPKVIVNMVLEYCAIWEEEEEKAPYPYFLDGVFPHVSEELLNHKTRITGVCCHQDHIRIALKYVLTLEIQAKRAATPPPKVLIITKYTGEWKDIFQMGREYYPWLGRDQREYTQKNNYKVRWAFTGSHNGGDNNISLSEIQAVNWDVIISSNPDFSPAFYHTYLPSLQQAKHVIAFDCYDWISFNQMYFIPMVEPILQAEEKHVTIISASHCFMEVRKRNVAAL